MMLMTLILSELLLMYSNTEQFQQQQLQKQKEISPEEIFDQIMIDIQTQSVNRVIEQAMTKAFDIEQAILWICYKSEECFFSPTLSQVSPLDKGIISYCYTSKLMQLSLDRN